MKTAFRSLMAGKNLTVIIAGLALVMVIALLVGKNYLAQLELQASVLKNFRQDLEKQATVLSYFCAEQVNDLNNLPAKREISIFFANKALGMSMEYGLKASLSAIQEGLDQYLLKRKLEGDQIYTRYVFIDAAGECLIDTQTTRKSMSPKKIDWRHFLTPKRATSFIVVDAKEGLAQLIISSPFFFKGTYAGQILAWLSNDTFLKHLLTGHGKFPGEVLAVFARQGTHYFPLAKVNPEISSILPQLGTMGEATWRRFYQAAPMGSEIEILASRVTIKGTPLYLLGIIPANRAFGHMTPWHLLAALGSLSILSLLVIWFVWRSNNRNLILQTRLEEADIREKEIAAKNRQLEEEIAERKQAEAALQKSEEWHKTILQTAMDGFWRADLNGRLLEVNAAYCRMSGFSEQELLAMSIADLETGERPSDIATRLEKITRQGEDRYETKHRCKDGSIIELEVSVQYKPAEGGQIVAFLRDITDRKRAEEEKARLEARLFQAQKMEAIGTLAGGIAHDFNNILGSITGFTELTLHSVPRDSQEYYHLDQVLKAGERARDLVKQILIFSRRAPQTKSPLEINSVVKEALKLLRASLPTTITIKENFAISSALVFADLIQVHQILMNLGTNAAHAMRENGGLLEVGLEEVSLNERDMVRHPDLSPGPYVKLTVRDTGQGMDQETMSHIFEPFFTTKAVGEGTGMGLAVVHGIVKSSGGEITVTSRPGEGTTFVILLPKILGEVATPSAASHPLPTGNDSILFIDDEEMLVNITKEMLKKLGYQVVAQASSLEALKIFHDQPEKFDLVITDQTMPQMTGMQLAQEVKQIRPDIPIILCTGYSEKVSLENMKAAGINDLLMKPVIMRTLAETIRKVLD